MQWEPVYCPELL
jgi:hypothetical protein